MTEVIARSYEALVLRRPWLSLLAVALLIPFTFHLPATQGLILLGAAYTSTVAGGPPRRTPPASAGPARSSTRPRRTRPAGCTSTS